MTGYWSTLSLLLLSRALDLWSTWLVCPGLRREANPIVRRLGWRRALALNAVACPLLALNMPLATMLTAASLFLAAANCVVAMSLRRNPLAGVTLILSIALLAGTCSNCPTFGSLGMIAGGFVWVALHLLSTEMR